MESYTALRKSALRKDYTKITVIGGLFIAGYALFKGDYIFTALGLVIVYVSLYSKDVVIDENGLTTHYHAIFYNKSKTYPMSDYTELRVVRAIGSEITIGFVRNGINTSCLFTREDGENVIDFVQEHNPNIIVREIRSGRGRRF
jgi:hypothetical protein